MIILSLGIQYFHDVIKPIEHWVGIWRRGEGCGGKLGEILFDQFSKLQPNCNQCFDMGVLIGRFSSRFSGKIWRGILPVLFPGNLRIFSENPLDILSNVLDTKLVPMPNSPEDPSPKTMKDPPKTIDFPEKCDLEFMATQKHSGFEWFFCFKQRKLVFNINLNARERFVMNWK